MSKEGEAFKEVFGHTMEDADKPAHYYINQLEAQLRAAKRHLLTSALVMLLTIVVLVYAIYAMLTWR